MSDTQQHKVTVRKAASRTAGRPDALPMYHFSCGLCGYEDNTRMSPGRLNTRATEHEATHSK